MAVDTDTRERWGSEDQRRQIEQHLIRAGAALAGARIAARGTDVEDRTRDLKDGVDELEREVRGQ